MQEALLVCIIIIEESEAITKIEVNIMATLTPCDFVNFICLYVKLNLLMH